MGSYYGEKIYAKNKIEVSDKILIISGLILKIIDILAIHNRILFFPQYLVDAVYTFF